MKKQRQKIKQEHIHLFVSAPYADVFRSAAATRDISIKKLFEMLVTKLLAKETKEFSAFIESENSKLKV